ncbi:MAG: DUF4954 family protein [Spirochaetaceae bacterium]|nr:DUF4954 family protein [Spirochaetaceae bacterium]
MTKIEFANIDSFSEYNYFPSQNDLAGKRQLTENEKNILIKNYNHSSDSDWNNIYVSEQFDANLIKHSEFSGTIVIGNLQKANLKFHDLVLETGIYHSKVRSCVIGDNVAIRNVRYLDNYKIGNGVILFNIQEMSCTNHSKFGNGILKEGEPESNRIWIGVCNENGGRDILPFESMLPSDAYLWAKNRDDKELLSRFVELTEYHNDKKLNTYGLVEDFAVIKNASLIKDAKIGSCAYIKGAFKLKNITVLSSEDEPSQIGEGVEMVNGIMGYGSKVFYQAVAVRFVIGRNCQLKYGVRVLNTVLGDNSTVSCCELLNNLVYPFHEQHHNSSFLIATTIMGQSNIASGATIGSNHNSRSPDGEIVAGRGFWPGLCSDFKHNSKFASFVLVSKGSYQCELNITYPFSLVSINSTEQAISIIPAYWFQYNMFAMARNNSKFQKRDKRAVKAQHIETDPFAPDALQEIMSSLNRIIKLTARTLKYDDLQKAKDFLHQNPDADLTLEDPRCMKRYGAKIHKAARGYKEYRKVAKYFAVKTLANWYENTTYTRPSREFFNSILDIELFTEWENVGGQVIPSAKIAELFDLIKQRKINTWEEVHQFYEECQKNYEAYKARYSLWILEQLYARKVVDFSKDITKDILKDVIAVSTYMYESSISSREKDYTDYFRTITYKNQEEMLEVVGKLEDNSFLKELKIETENFNKRLEEIFAKI